MASDCGCCGDPQGGARKVERSSSALEILEERFARGEIDKGEFEEKCQIIGEARDANAATGSRKGCLLIQTPINEERRVRGMGSLALVAFGQDRRDVRSWHNSGMPTCFG